MTRLYLLISLLCSSIHLFSQWQQTGGPQGGNIYAIEQVGSTLWAGTDGGLYTSTDDGISWTLANLIPVENPVMNIKCYGDEVLMVTAHINDELEDWEFDFHRSTDLGQTWTTVPFPDNNYLLEGVTIGKSGDAIFVSVDFGYYRSLDNGITWTPVNFPDYASTMAFDEDRILMATYFELFISEDKGDTWTFVDSIGSQSSILLEDSLILVHTVYDSIHISQDLGDTWTVIPDSGDNFGGIFQRGSSGKLYSLGYNNIFVSEDDGFTWSPLNNTVSFYSPADMVEIGADLCLATSVGIFKNQNGQTFLPSNNGLIATNVYFLFASPSGELFAYTSAGNFRSPNGGLNWFPLILENKWSPIYDMEFVGDSIYLASDDNLYLSTGNEFVPLFPSGSYYGGYAVTYHEGTLFRIADDDVLFATDGGVNWNPLTLPSGTNGGWDDFRIVNGNYLLINSQGEGFLSTDNGANWAQTLDVFSPGAGNKHRFYHFGNYLYVPDNNDFWVSTDGGFTWNSIVPTGLPVIDDGTGWTEIVLPSSLAGIGNLLFASVRFNGVYFSSDNGLSWSPVHVGLGNLRTRSLALGAGVLYTGTSTGGVWRRGGQFESITGLVYADENNNGIKEPGELPLPQIVVKTSPLNSNTSTLLDGTFLLYGESFNDTLKAIPPTPYANVHPPFYLVQGQGAGHDFGIYFLPGMDDLCITATSLEPFRPGFDNTLFVTVKNIGTTVQSPTVVLEMPGQVTYLDATPSATSVAGNTITWELEALQPFASLDLQVQVVLDASTPIGGILTFMANVTPDIDDQNPANNAYFLREEVVGSYDPNDKAVEPLGFMTPTQLMAGDPLVYTIRFQNTGTYFAENVRILDTLSTKLDLASLQILASSHLCEWYVRNGTLLEFVFENIFLPDSTTNEPGSHGFVKFSIRPKSDLVLGDWIENEADIYFDFNAPIRTNAASIIIDYHSGTDNPVAENGASLFAMPNPNPGVFLLYLPIAPSEPGKLSLVDAAGTSIHRMDWPAGQRQLLVKLPVGLPTGLYFTQVAIGQRQWTCKILVDQ